LKLGFSHAKGLWHYKYISQGMKKKGEDKRKKPRKRPLQKPYKKNKKRHLQKKKGRGRILD